MDSSAEPQTGYGGPMTQEQNPLQPPASMLIKLMGLQPHPGENGEKKPRNNRKYVSDHHVEQEL